LEPLQSHGVNTLYGKYKLTETGPVLVEIGPKFHPYQPYIQLNNMSPAFSTEQDSCLTGEMGNNSEVADRCKAIPELFRSQTVSSVNVAATAFTNVFTLGGLAGPGGEPHGVGRYSYAVDFDDVAYQAMIAKLDATIDRFSITTLNDDAHKVLKDTLNESTYKFALTLFGISFSERDLSGFDVSPALFLDFNTSQPFEFQNCVVDSNASAYADLRQCLTLQLVRKVCQSFKSKLVAEVEVSCTKDSIALTLKKVGVRNAVPITSFENSDLVATTKNGSLYITNLTEKYLAIEALTIYLNGKGYTVTVDKQLAPNIQSPIVSINDFRLPYEHTHYTHKKLKDVENNKVDFGVAIKYTSTDTNKPQTLFHKDSFPLRTVILDNINSGNI
jgi:hypothetical protein